MARDFTDSVTGLLGPARSAAPSPDQALGDLERRLGVQLPDDYKEIIGSYAPVQLNGHLFLAPPSTGRWNLGEWVRETVEVFSRRDLTEAECPGFPDGPLFGGSFGLIPLVDTDR